MKNKKKIVVVSIILTTVSVVFTWIAFATRQFRKDKKEWMEFLDNENFYDVEISN